MARPRKKPEKENEEKSEVSAESNTASPKTTNKLDNTESVRIIFSGECLKLSSARGVGMLSYNLGIDETTNEFFIRISGNESSGAFNRQWINFNDIHEILDNIEEQSFKAVVLQKLFKNQSSNSHGYLAAILRAEGVLKSNEKQPASLQKGSWEEIKKRFESLKSGDTNLPDRLSGSSGKKTKPLKKRGRPPQKTVTKEKA